MARLNFVKSARASVKPRKCYRCGVPINIGEAYYWFANRLGRSSVRKDFCSAHRPKPSEMTTSEKLSKLYAAQEDAENVIRHEIPRDEWDDYKAEVSQALRDAAEVANEVKEEYEESRSNMPEGLQDSGTGAEIEEKAGECESWADELESAADEIDGMSAPEPEEPEEKSEAEVAATVATEDPDNPSEDAGETVDPSEINDRFSDAIGALSL